tara:strand:+ start:3950 stop:4165 length:216 start_codon:yes stop_codon:yes gene_type:complete
VLLLDWDVELTETALDDVTLLLKIELAELAKSLELEIVELGILELDARLISELESSQALQPVNAPVINVGV